MRFKELIDNVICRGNFISNKIMYENIGNIPVYSATTTGPVGFIKDDNDKFNYYITKDNSFLVSLNGNAGFISLVKENTKIFVGSDCGVIEIKPDFLKKYDKEIVALWLQDFCVRNRHVNGTQPKFSITKSYDKKINIKELESLSFMDFSEINKISKISKQLSSLKFNTDSTGKNRILLKDFISHDFFERGRRLVKGRELYRDHGNIKAISSTTTGPMGFYKKQNYYLKDNDFVYSIDGANAGYISLYKPQEVWITDHAGVISVKKEYLKKFGKLAISLFLQDYFIKLRTTGTQPTFLLKNNLNLLLDLNKLEALSKIITDELLQ